MDYVNLGKSGLKVSRLCLGMMSYGSTKWREWVLDEEAAKPFVKRALEAGINFFDTAEVDSLRGKERRLRRVLAGKVRYLGASSMYAWQFAKALFTADLHGWERFISMQNHYNLIYREEEREMIPLCVDQGIGL